MTRLAKQGSIFAALAGVALFACVPGEKTAQSADSTARNLTLAPTESTAALKDVPAPATEAAKPAPEKKAPVKKPDRKSTRLNSSHRCISYAVFCLKKKNISALTSPPYT